MINATDYRAMAAEHHRLAGMCRAPESREQHFRLEIEFRALADNEESVREARAPQASVRAADHQVGDPRSPKGDEGPPHS